MDGLGLGSTCGLGVTPADVLGDVLADVGSGVAAAVLSSGSSKQRPPLLRDFVDDIEDGLHDNKLQQMQPPVLSYGRRAAGCAPFRFIGAPTNGQSQSDSNVGPVQPTRTSAVQPTRTSDC